MERVGVVTEFGEKRDDAVAVLAARLADPAFYEESPEEVARVTREHGELVPQIEALEAEWLELSEEIESIS